MMKMMKMMKKMKKMKGSLKQTTGETSCSDRQTVAVIAVAVRGTVQCGGKNLV